MPNGHVTMEMNAMNSEDWLDSEGASSFEICMPSGHVDIFHVVLPWWSPSVSTLSTHWSLKAAAGVCLSEAS